MMKSVSAVIPAAGLGKRFSADRKKQFYSLQGNTILQYTLQALSRAYPFTEYVIGVMTEDRAAATAAAESLGIKNVILAQGDEKRCGTVYNALLKASGEYAAVHDSVRPFITPAMVRDTVDLAMKHGGAICGVPAVDTVKRVQHGEVVETLDRSGIFLAHTPQVFHRETLLAAMKKTMDGGVEITDEASAYEYMGYKVMTSPSTKDNIKITQPEDILLAAQLIEKYFRVADGSFEF